mmetsp:Transcript_12399/g.9014  ORF Transcript_12399/g.9014 Transcript_12399/m.9014 type:complete len:149 (+) Transcript_12399:688-1134(+)
MEVRFRHFFLADVLTSFGTPLKDLSYMSCFFFASYWKDSSEATCAYLTGLNYFLSYLPYWFRFAQCLRKYRDSQVKAQLVNSGKYFMNLLSKLFSMLMAMGAVGNITYIVVSSASTMYSYSWDIYMDWGLLRSRSKGTYMLREKILYP